MSGGRASMQEETVYTASCWEKTGRGGGESLRRVAGGWAGLSNQPALLSDSQSCVGLRVSNVTWLSFRGLSVRQ